MQKIVSSALVVRSAFYLAGCGAFTLLLLYCSVRVLVQGDWLSGGLALLLTLALAFATRRWFLRLRSALAARSAVE